MWNANKMTGFFISIHHFGFLSKKKNNFGDVSASKWTRMKMLSRFFVVVLFLHRDIRESSFRIEIWTDTFNMLYSTCITSWFVLFILSTFWKKKKEWRKTYSRFLAFRRTSDKLAIHYTRGSRFNFRYSPPLFSNLNLLKPVFFFFFSWNTYIYVW